MYAGRRQIVRNIRESSSEESGWMDDRDTGIFDGRGRLGWSGRSSTGARGGKSAVIGVTQIELEPKFPYR
jgi:hypothetical protein